MQNQIKEFNEQLVENNIDIDIIDYVKNINEQFFKINISFIDDFIDLVDKDHCCIPHEFLKKYGVTQMTAGSSDVKKILNNNSSIDGIDHMILLSRTADEREQITYILHPTIFKKILIRSRNTDKFADYYLLLEKCMKHYNDYYQLKLKKKISDDNKIKLLLLTESETLDNFSIYKCDEDTMYLRKNPHAKGFISTAHDYEEFPYALINGSNKNVNKIIKACNIKPENRLVRIKCPSYTNFVKKVREVLGDKFIRKISEYEDSLDNNTSRVSVTRFFRIINITEENFLNEINILHLSRGNNIEL